MEEEALSFHSSPCFRDSVFSSSSSYLVSAVERKAEKDFLLRTCATNGIPDVTTTER